jgi:protein-L-isoaspartate(D-aspartate) O-methyltransferase
MNIEQARFNMIEQQIRPWGVLDATVLSLLAVVKREDFVPPEHQSLAFMDLEVPLPEGQRMLSPKMEARLLQELALHKHERVLEIGAGSGHMAALLAHRAGQVITVEKRAALARLAATNLQRAAVVNAEVRHLDGAAGLPAETPFDAILLSGSVAELPQALLNQLKIGGRLIAVVGHEPIMRAVRVTRRSEGGFDHTELFDTVAPRLEGFPERSRFSF